ncbi:hypothetical protein [uncultured Acinetobacter sp.]|jgi:virulence-associated protein VapD|uniref:hypothetical protein n=1 Tax=uncultured Acinetobacter sp. TaxID=165433 RepID=UPI00261B2D86|nr:hypothetical protein [uncultured Acinetobacter sp.]
MSKYLITFDMSTECLKANYHGNNYTNAYSDIGRILRKHGFNSIQGSVYMGDEGISEAHGTVAIQELTFQYDWFYTCVSNIRFFRLESDLNAQFIADGVHNAKIAFQQRISQLRQSLEAAGLDVVAIEQIIAKQNFEMENFQTIPLKKGT